jgi:hypothetical protein
MTAAVQLQATKAVDFQFQICVEIFKFKIKETRQEFQVLPTVVLLQYVR